MFRSLKRKFRKILTCLKHIEGPVKYRFICNDLLGREILHQLTIAEQTIHIRSHTPDFKVAINSLVKDEYGYLRIDNPKIIIDAGANIGTSALSFAKQYPDARIICIEPEDQNFSLLQKNIASHRNITAIQSALWGTPKKRPIKNRFTGHWGYTISETENKTESTGQEIECLTIGLLMEKYEIATIDLLKMDIEGAEKDVLENSSAWIDSVKVMTVELHDKICQGCDRAFYLATGDFKTFEKHAEKVTAYRN